MKHVLGITGGIGSGKSLVCALLEERGIPVFYTDDEAKAEMRENAGIHRDLINLLGPGAISSDGQPVKAVLADYISERKYVKAHFSSEKPETIRPRADRSSSDQ